MRNGNVWYESTWVIWYRQQNLSQGTVCLFSGICCTSGIPFPFGDAYYLTHWPLGDFNKSYKIIFKLILMIDGCDILSEIALRWTSLNLSDDKSTLVQVMAWCRQATSHYLNQSWPRSLPPYGVTRPQWVKLTPFKSLSVDTMVQEIACYRAGYRPLHYPMMIQLTDVNTPIISCRMLLLFHFGMWSFTHTRI